MKTRMNMMLGIFFILAFNLAACGGSSGGSSDGGSSDGGGDTTSPYVNSTNPVHNATTAAINRAVTATFNEAIDPVTINVLSFILDDQNGAPISGNVSYDAASRTAVFRNGTLAPGTTYTATITSDVEDLAGNALANDYSWQFTTSVTPPFDDTTPPVVQSRFPAPNANSVATNATVSVTFSEPIDPTTINSQSLTLNLNGTTPVSGTVTYIGTTALFTPSTNLVASATYTVSVAGTIKDLAGNTMTMPVVWNFTTGNVVDLQAPIVLSVAPPDGAVNVPTDSLVMINFNEAIKPFEFGLLDGRPVTVTFNATYTTVTLDPTAVLLPGLTYTASTNVVDQAGNRMAELFVWQFTTSQ